MIRSWCEACSILQYTRGDGGHNDVAVIASEMLQHADRAASVLKTLILYLGKSASRSPLGWEARKALHPSLRRIGL